MHQPLFILHVHSKNIEEAARTKPPNVCRRVQTASWVFLGSYNIC